MPMFAKTVALAIDRGSGRSLYAVPFLRHNRRPFSQSQFTQPKQENRMRPQPKHLAVLISALLAACAGQTQKGTSGLGEQRSARPAEPESQYEAMQYAEPPKAVISEPEPAPEEPMAEAAPEEEEPVAEEEPAPEEPMAEEPAPEEPVVAVAEPEEPAPEQPMAEEEPTAEEEPEPEAPMAEEPAPEEPVAAAEPEQPAPEQPVFEEEAAPEEPFVALAEEAVPEQPMAEAVEAVPEQPMAEAEEAVPEEPMAEEEAAVEEEQPEQKEQLVAAAEPEKPEPKPVVLPVTITLEAEPWFDFDRYAVRSDAREKLDKLAGDLTGLKYDQILVVGHADRIGTPEYNQRLSERRANSVKSYLAGKGLPAERIKTEGRGEFEPSIDPQVCKGLRKQKLIDCLQPDRRVEVTVTGTKLQQ